MVELLVSKTLPKRRRRPSTLNSPPNNTKNHNPSLNMQLHKSLHQLSNRLTTKNRILALRHNTTTATAAGATSSHFSTKHRTTPTPEIAQALHSDGLVIIKSMFNPLQISRLNQETTPILSRTPAGKPANPTTPPLPNNMDPEVFGANTKRLGSLLNHSPTYRTEILDSDVLHTVSASALQALGDYWLSTAQMIEIGPGSQAQPLHADGAGWWPFWSMGDTWNPEFCLNFLIACSRTTKANGATGVVRGSHRISFGEMARDPTFGFWNAVPEDAVEQAELEVGDCLVLGGRMVHRGGANVTGDEVRRVLSCTVVSASLTPEEAHPFMLLDQGVKEELPERVRKFLGFGGGLKTGVGPDVWQDYKV